MKTPESQVPIQEPGPALRARVTSWWTSTRSTLSQWPRWRWFTLGAIAVVAVLALGARGWERVPDGPVYAQRVVDEINTARADSGVTELTTDQCLVDAAAAAVDTYQYQTVIAASADASLCEGESFELITRSTKDASDLVARWATLARYGEAMLNPDATRIGAACVRGGSPYHPMAVCSVLIASGTAPASS